MVTLQLRQITVPLGQRILFHDLTWLQFEAILAELGENRASRIAYYQGTLEIRMPLPEHEVNKEIIGDMVKILLEELEIDRECFGSTTFKRQDMDAGVEPDNCFYIKNYRSMIGKTRIDLTVDPPPDLVIEVDVTYKTQLKSSEALRVPELWQYEKGKLKIYVLQDGQYVESQVSPNFPDLPLIDEIEHYLELSQVQGTSFALREFRKCVISSK